MVETLCTQYKIEAKYYNQSEIFAPMPQNAVSERTLSMKERGPEGFTNFSKNIL